ncbi:hypothetical protein [Pedobacter ghigonis]|uniref:hypothetical protein n=1 Tax=Pedobacter ghigonis TaxID=2730403 RepID=UPI00158BF464|nr:hypothetical protein [Pedobacter ghigonis]
MKKVFILLSLFLSVYTCFGQQENKEAENPYAVALGYLKWYNSVEYGDQSSTIPKQTYPIVKDIPVDKKFKRQAINKIAVEKYIEYYKKSGFLSESYLNTLRSYFAEINKDLVKRPPIRRDDRIKIDGLDLDIQLQTFEPEAILDNLAKATLTKSLIIYNKALLGVNFAPEINLVFALSKYGDKWLIDYIGHNNTSANSFFRQ